MRRTYFLWLDKLKIKPAERKLMISLIFALTVLSLIHISLPDEYDSAKEPTKRQRELDKVFQERSALIAAQRDAKMQQYFPTSTDDDQPQATDKALASAGIVEQDQTEASSQNSSINEVRNSDNKPIRVDVNSADAATLQQLPGIGPAYAQRIITYRNQQGAFKTPDELKKIKGIGPKRLEKLLPYLDQSTFNGKNKSNPN